MRLLHCLVPLLLASLAAGAAQAQDKASPPQPPAPDSARFGDKPIANPLPQPATTAGSAPDSARFGDAPMIANPLPQPATTAEPAPLPSATDINPDRFGGKKSDPAYGAFQRGLYKTAYNFALPRAQNGDPAAQTLLAEILSRGLGVPANASEAAKWYALAAEQGVPESQFQYALMLLDGKYVKKDEKEAYALMQAAAEAGNRLAQFNFAQLLVEEEPGDAGLDKAVSYYERAAATGLADAQYAMSQIYANGVGGKAKDDVAARRLLVQAARQNFDTAQIDLGEWMIEGRGGRRDLKSGFGWTKLAADGGNVAAQNRLAKLYMGGIGTDPDSILAGAWYVVARRAGLVDPEMDDFMEGLTVDETKQVLQRSNRLP